MPLIDEGIHLKQNQPFKKKPYRPWNIYESTSEEHTSQTKSSVGKKKESNRNQLDINLKSEKIPIRYQLDINNKSNRNHKDIEKNKLDTKLEPIRNPKRDQNHIYIVSNQQSVSQQKELASDSFRRLYGLQRKIVFYVVNQCVLRGQLNSGPITNESLRELTNTDSNTIKTALTRLVNKGFLVRENGKIGRGGFVSFRITEAVRNAAMEELQHLSISNQLATNWVSYKESKFPSSSSSQTTTTTPEYHKISLPEKWERVDITPLEPIRFTKAHVEQIYKSEKITPEILQESIYAFAFDIENNNKIASLKLSPLNFFIGILRKGSPYLPPENYESPEEKALRLYIQRKKDLAAKKLAQEKEALQISFDEWFSLLSQEEMTKLCPPEYAKDKSSMIFNGYLFNHFKDAIWPKIKRNLVNGV